MNRMTRKTKLKRIMIIMAVLLLAIIVVIAIKNNPQKQNFASENGEDFVQVMDVGQGDSILLYSNGKSFLIDMSISSKANEICKDLSDSNIKSIDVAMVTHFHTDHIGGFEKITEIYKIKKLIIPEILSSSIKAANKAKQTIIDSSGSVYTAVQGMNFNVGDFKVTVLGNYHHNNENNRSIFTMAEIDGIRFLFTGDAEKWADNKLLQEGLDLDCDVLKVSHHGGNSSTSLDFLKATTPQYAAISVGAGNTYSHPHDVTLMALKNIGAKVYRTDLQGDIFFYIENGKIKTKTEK